MKKNEHGIQVTAVAIGLVWACATSGTANAQDKNAEAEYRNQWLKTERSVTKGKSRDTKDEERMQELQTYFEMGNDYVEKKDYPAALICFRNIIAMEKTSSNKLFSPEAALLIQEIERKLKDQIEAELSADMQQDWDRLKAGSTKILARIKEETLARPLAVPPPPAPKKPEVKPKPVTPEDEIAARRKAIEKEIEAKKQALLKDLELRKLEWLKKEKEQANILETASAMFKEGKYSDALGMVERILHDDPDHAGAKELKGAILVSSEKNKYLAEKKEVERLRLLNEQKYLTMKAEEEKRLTEQREAQQASGLHLNRAKNHLKHFRYREAIEELQASLKADPDNFEASEILNRVTANMQKARDILPVPPEQPPTVVPGPLTALPEETAPEPVKAAVAGETK